MRVLRWHTNYTRRRLAVPRRLPLQYSHRHTLRWIHTVRQLTLRLTATRAWANCHASALSHKAS